MDLLDALIIIVGGTFLIASLFDGKGFRSSIVIGALMVIALGYRWYF